MEGQSMTRLVEERSRIWTGAPSEAVAGNDITDAPLKSA
jgi:hypothetical protein